MDDFLTAIALVIALNAAICLYRAAVGPTTQDRLLGVNIVGTKALVLVLLVTFIFSEIFYQDVAIVYALLLIRVIVPITRYLETEGCREVE